jgi:RNA polymerase-binding transcription factor DksA
MSRFIVPARFARKITIREGAASMVAKKTPAKKTTADTPAAGGGAPPGKRGGAVAGGDAPAGGGRAAAKRAAPRKAAPARGTAAKRTATGKRAAGRQGAADEDAAQAAQETTGATTVVAKKTRGTATAAQRPTEVPKARTGAVDPEELAVRPGEEPWTREEVDEARAELTAEVLRLGAELESSEASLAGLMRDSGDGAGDDEADTGTKNITREHELALAANAREMLIQTERALERLGAGTYGICEACGNPIGKARMQAFPRATLCVADKQKQERR